MPIEVTCHKCGRDYRLKDELAGKRIRCKSCETRIEVPWGDDDPWGSSADFDDAYGEPFVPAARKRKSRKKTGPNIWLSSGAFAGYVVGGFVLLLMIGVFAGWWMDIARAGYRNTYLAGPTPEKKLIAAMETHVREVNDRMRSIQTADDLDKVFNFLDEDIPHIRDLAHEVADQRQFEIDWGLCSPTDIQDRYKDLTDESKLEMKEMGRQTQQMLEEKAPNIFQSPFEARNFLLTHAGTLKRFRERLSEIDDISAEPVKAEKTRLTKLDKEERELEAKAERERRAAEREEKNAELAKKREADRKKYEAESKIRAAEEKQRREETAERLKREEELRLQEREIALAERKARLENGETSPAPNPNATSGNPSGESGFRPGPAGRPFPSRPERPTLPPPSTIEGPAMTLVVLDSEGVPYQDYMIALDVEGKEYRKQAHTSRGVVRLTISPFEGSMAEIAKRLNLTNATLNEEERTITVQKSSDCPFLNSERLAKRRAIQDSFDKIGPPVSGPGMEQVLHKQAITKLAAANLTPDDVVAILVRQPQTDTRIFFYTVDLERRLAKLFGATKKYRWNRGDDYVIWLAPINKPIEEVAEKIGYATNVEVDQQSRLITVDPEI
ncbi:hypothetical protein [Calycomorphotria hydatis]|uniref:Uncharacterized protein n=1 Tax=Calycomorphotria hydatis TaxID=2528027 RepID=A0A517T537_9PLAN|nr:hypothetical protein [Calycomorphotria hydatis]QDT63451.1 hypothetical protein V22_06730 [Calycomorphotria hydatis]